jgi:hypothetical protein
VSLPPHSGRQLSNLHELRSASHQTTGDPQHRYGVGEHGQRITQTISVANIARGMAGERVVDRLLYPSGPAQVLEAMSPRMVWRLTRIDDATGADPTSDDLRAVSAASAEPIRSEIRKEWTVRWKPSNIFEEAFRDERRMQGHLAAEPDGLQAFALIVSIDVDEPNLLLFSNVGRQRLTYLV